MISDLSLQLTVDTPIPVPTGAYALPGSNVILARPAPGGVAPPTTAEALTGMKRTDYHDIFYEGLDYIGPSVVQPNLYAINPRKDGTSPELSPSRSPYDEASIAKARAATFARNKAKAQAAIAARNNTGKVDAATVATNIEGNAEPLNLLALLALIGIAFFVLRRR